MSIAFESLGNIVIDDREGVIKIVSELDVLITKEVNLIIEVEIEKEEDINVDKS